jgi:hypothetical protein
MAISLNIMFQVWVESLVTHGGIAVPEIHVDIGQGVASVGVNELDVYVQSNTLLVIDDILADELTAHVWYLLDTSID